MAGLFARFAPQIMGAMGGGDGILGGLKRFAGGVLKDLGSGGIKSGGDFGKSLARNVYNAINPADQINAEISSTDLNNSKNAADDETVVIRGETAPMVGNPAAEKINLNLPFTKETDDLRPESAAERLQKVGGKKNSTFRTGTMESLIAKGEMDPKYLKIEKRKEKIRRLKEKNKALKKK